MTETLYGPGFFVERHSTVTASAAVVVPLIVELLQPRSVVDVGCGKGEWLDAFPLEVDVFGVDISAPEDEEFIRTDLTRPLDLGKRFDLALCLEVGEHLPRSAAYTLVDSLIRHAPKVVFSAAVPGQEGIGHINCQPHDYWHRLFKARGYEMSDPFRPQLTGDGRVSAWYRDNIYLYERSPDMPLSIGGTGGLKTPDQLVAKGGKGLPRPSGEMKPPKIKVPKS